MIQQEFSSIIFTLYFIYYFFSDTEQNSSRILNRISDFYEHCRHENKPIYEQNLSKPN